MAKKRAAGEQEVLAWFSNEKLIGEISPFIDDLGRARNTKPPPRLLKLRTWRWKVTHRGKRIMAASLALRDIAFPELFRKNAAA